MIAVLSQKGPTKTESEDLVLAGHRVLCDDECCISVPKQGFICVADGVGGVAGGKKAALFLTDALERTEQFPQTEDELKTYLKLLNDRLITDASGTPDASMAATLTGILLTDRFTALFHAGNTRAFLMQGNYLRQLTDDHTLKQRLLQMGLTEKASQVDPSELIGCFGGGNISFISALTVFPLPEFQTLLLTSDGIHDYLSADQMEEILLSDLPDREKCRLLLETARQNGSADDASILILRKQ